LGTDASSNAAPDRPLSVDEYLAFERRSATKHEFVDGQRWSAARPGFYDGAEDVLLNPSIIVDVLSDSTERVDRGEKLGAYTSMPSVTDYLLIASKRVRVEHFARARNWQPVVLGTSDRVAIATPAIELHVDELYARVF
jgi:Uma2 family endonuclease